MTSYQNDIMNLLQGDTPKQKYDNLVKMKELLTILASPFPVEVERHYSAKEVEEIAKRAYYIGADEEDDIEGVNKMLKEYAI